MGRPWRVRGRAWKESGEAMVSAVTAMTLKRVLTATMSLFNSLPIRFPKVSVRTCGHAR